MISENKTGCCFITVDAYAPAVDFYIKNGFQFLGNKEQRRYEAWLDRSVNNRKDEEKEKHLPTIAMYFNLLSMLPDSDKDI